MSADPPAAPLSPSTLATANKLFSLFARAVRVVEVEGADGQVYTAAVPSAMLCSGAAGVYDGGGTGRRGEAAPVLAERLGIPLAALPRELRREDTTVHTRDEDGRSLLFHAAFLGNLEAVKACLASVEVDVVDNDGHTPLFTAAYVDAAPLVDTLIDAGGSVDYRDPKGLTPLAYACVFQQINAAQALCRRGADIEAGDLRGRRPLHLAATRGYIDIVAWLISEGADVEARTRLGHTPLMSAAKEDQALVAELLVATGVQVDARSTAFEQTALHLAASRGARSCAEVLLLAGADVNARDRRGMTPFLWAQQQRQRPLVEFLRLNGADASLEPYPGILTQVDSATDAGVDIPFSALDLGDRIGSGAFGSVVRAQYRGEAVAVKKLDLPAFSDAHVMWEVLTEVSFLIVVGRHPNIVRTIGIAKSFSDLHLVMELCSKSLFDALRETPAPRHQDRLRWAAEVSAALTFLHHHEPKILHRDITSTNVLVGNDAKARLSDFGLSAEDLGAEDGETAVLTKFKPAYAAPEVFAGEAYTPKSDVFSLGVVLLELCVPGLDPVDALRRGRPNQASGGVVVVPASGEDDDGYSVQLASPSSGAASDQEGVYSELLAAVVPAEPNIGYDPPELGYAGCQPTAIAQGGGNGGLVAPPLLVIPAEVGAAEAALIEACWAPNPSDRPTALGFLAALPRR